MATTRNPTKTSPFGTGRRENHDASPFYDRFDPPTIDDTNHVNPALTVEGPILGDSRHMREIPDRTVALVVTSPPYFVGKEYEKGGENIPTTYAEYLDLLRDVLAECVRVVEPGGRVAVNVANLGRKPYRSLSSDTIGILEELGLLLRGEVIWRKAKAAGGTASWGSFRHPSNPVLRDVTERIVIASKDRFDRAVTRPERKKRGLPHRPTISSDEFVDATLDVWDIPPERAGKVGHPAPFPVGLPLRLVDLYTYENDLVLDPFMGSGSTLIAAQIAGRRAVGYDTQPEYVKIAKQRLGLAATRGIGYATNRKGGAEPLSVEILRNCGFDVTPNRGTVGGYHATNPHDVRWQVIVAGRFTSVQPGLLNGDVLWKTLARSHLHHMGEDQAPLIVLTPHIPATGTSGWKALQAATPSSVFDVIQIDTEQCRRRLEWYSKQAIPEPATGFWSEQQLRRFLTAQPNC